MLALGVLVAPGPTTVAVWAPTGDILPGPTAPIAADVDIGGRFGKGVGPDTVPPFGNCGTFDANGTELMGGTELIGNTEDIGGTVAR